ncbi:MAG: hypothetical protein ACFFEV_01905 [Candidatus Thorarchaeota archaeon]
MSGVCRNTGMNTEECKCLECQPETLTFSEIIGEPETIENLLRGANIPHNIRFKLHSMIRQDYFIERITSDRIIFKRFSREGYYWMRCDCGNIVETPIAGYWTEYCKKCNPQESDSSGSMKLAVFILLTLIPICAGMLWMVFSSIGILPALEWPLSMIPILLLGAPGLIFFIWFQIDQYKLKKKRRNIREQIRNIAKY